MTFQPWMYLGQLPRDVIDEDEDQFVLCPGTEAVVRYLLRVQRLRQWREHLDFGMMVDDSRVICRIALGFGRGFTNWMEPHQMVELLDDEGNVDAAR